MIDEQVNSETPDVITLQQCVSSAKMLLRIENSDNDIWFGKLGNDAIRRLNSPSIFVKNQVELTIHNCKAELPDDYQDFLAMRLHSDCNTDGVQSSLQYGFVYVDYNFLKANKINADSNFTQASTGTFQINGGWILFYGNIEDGTVVDFAYKAKNVDENGLQVVYSRYEDALTSYICYNYCLSNPKEYIQYIITEHKMNWQAQKRMLKAYDARQSFNNEKAQIREIVNALVTDKGQWTVGAKYF